MGSSIIKKSITILGILFGVGILLIVAGHVLQFLILVWSVYPRTYGPYSLEEARSIEAFHPLYHPSAETERLVGPLELSYYHYAAMDDVEIDVYFTGPGEEGQPERVARMLVYPNTFSGATIYQSKVPISWASEALDKMGKRCAPSVEYNPDKITGPPYQTCLSWISTSGEAYALYTIWPEEKTLQFIDSFVKAKPPLQSNTGQ